MTSDRQLAANKRNAQRSTGPRTIAGKNRSSRNSYKYGLSLPLKADDTMRDQMELLVRQAAGPEASIECLEAAAEFATAYYDVVRVRKIHTEMLSSLNLAKATPEQLNELVAVDRYDRRAMTKQRRAARRLRLLRG